LKGYAILVGVRYVNPNRYCGWSDQLDYSEKDIEDMQDILDRYNFDSELITTTQATCNTVKASINQCAGNLDENDLMVIYYSGHGAMRDSDFPSDPYPNDPELDDMDDCWCLYDRPLWDDELLHLLPLSKKVRILIISDSCNSGSMLDTNSSNMLSTQMRQAKLFNSAPSTLRKLTKDQPKVDKKGVNHKDKRIPFEYILKFKPEFREFTRFDKSFLLNQNIKATVMHLASCLEGESSEEGVDNSYFMQALKVVAQDSNYNINYNDLIEDINDYLITSGRAVQEANISTLGVNTINFRNQKIFTVS
jgi:hypothetical protein